MKHLLTHLGILALCTGSLNAQSPGGVGNPELWFKTVPVSSDLNGNYRWQDFSGDSLRLNVYNSQGASFGEEFVNTAVRFFNGYPALTLNKLLDSNNRNVLLKRSSLSQATIIGLFAPNANFNSESLLFGLNGRPGQGVWVGNNKIYPGVQSGKAKFDYGESEGMDLMYSSNDVESNANDFRVHSARIAAYYRSVPPATGIWGDKDKAVLSFGTYKSNDVNSNSAFSLTSSENRAFSGYIPEFIAYNRLLNPLERRQVDSYLAVKYALTLPVSLIGSRGQLLWDYTANPDYNHRVAGLYRDNASGLYQKESATTYEESPSYSDANDYFYLNNPNNRSSSSRLLVLGRQEANPMQDGNYLFWGDDNSSIALHSIEGKLGLRKIDRVWKVVTNIPQSAPADRLLNWQVQDLQVSAGANGFISTFVKSASSSAPEQGTAFTAIPLKEKDGYLGLTNMSLLSGNLYLKFGSNTALLTPNSHDYGYYISGTSVYPVVKGIVLETSVATLILTSKIELEKQNDEIYLRADGSRINNSRIAIVAEDANKTFYGGLGMAKGVLDGSVDLRHGGFTDTGNKIELSYASDKASGFRNDGKGTSLLLIDRTGTGNFDLNTAEIIEVSEIDISRRKAIFNNVFLNNGDAFTFAYRESDLSGEVETIDPACNQSDGEITVHLSTGVPAFNYKLTRTSTGEVVRQGKEYAYTIHLDGLSGGEYELNISEAGGFNFNNGDGSGSTRAKTTNFLPVFEGSLTWTVGNTADNYSVGYTTILEDVNSTKNIIHYGLKKQGDKLYQIVNKKVSTSVLTTVQVGDIIQVSKSMSGIKFYKNGTQIGSGSISILDYLVKFYGLVDMSNGKAELLNVKGTGFFELADYNWTGANNMGVFQSNNASLSYTFTLEDPCENTQAGGEAPVPTAAAPEVMSIFYRNVGDTKSVTARVELAEPEVVTFAAYNLSGVLVKKVNLPVPRILQEADFDFSQAGVYIIKAITTTGEYSRKVMVN
ncbi:T9SS type A sorting domain-containing protein [Dysgonomonas sp. GY617]|uniref:T9SS type A sorting domain-containing protein n=1 Tax=Dysgonomonas sp. GY617 TaxID=2780420 RepID=UPI001883E47D|nr:T9SS type A sorting domain-containing protein [Dysgonomonas sp. GY617]MBF0575577.1 T9SS type A sorting domain-containing protein [Dysgonomonas sp. GY617]